MLYEEKYDRIKKLYSKAATIKREVCCLLPLKEAESQETFEFTNEYLELLTGILENTSRLESLAETYYQTLHEMFDELKKEQSSFEEKIDFDLYLAIEKVFSLIKSIVNLSSEVPDPRATYFCEGS